MSYDKCKTCLHQSSTGQPVFDNRNCATCITQGNYLGYELAPKVETDNKQLKRDSIITWICLVITHMCFIVACLATGLYILLFAVNVIWLVLTALAAVIIDVGFIYIMYLIITGTKFKKR